MTAVGDYLAGYSDNDLIDQLVMRGYVVHAHRSGRPTPAASVAVHEETDLDRWLAVWNWLDEASRQRRKRDDDTEDAEGSLLIAMTALVELIQPPSVRVARKLNADAEASSRT